MSRTYRGRHLPVLPGSARKIQFGVGKFGWKERDKIVEPLVDAVLGKPQSKPSWSSAEWRVRRQVREQIEKSIIWPVARYHPWMWFMGVDTSCKGWYKRHGNRVMRRHNKGLLKTKTLDEDWTGHFMTYDDAFDLWSID